MHERRVAVAGAGVNLWEAGQGPPVVLLHGLLGSPAYLLPLARSLARSGRRVLAPGLPGHGGSAPLRPFEFAVAADRLASAAAQLGVERPALLGHSFGAPLAAHWALRHDVRSIVAVSPVGMAPLELSWARWLLPLAPALAPVARMGAAGVAASAVGRRAVFGGFVGMARPQATPPELGAEMIRAAADAAPSVADALDALGRLRLAAVASSLTVPTLVVWGDRDAHAANGPALAGALPEGRSHVIAGVGHMPMLEAPYAFRRALDGWL